MTLDPLNPNHMRPNVDDYRKRRFVVVLMRFIHARNGILFLAAGGILEMAIFYLN